MAVEYEYRCRECGDVSYSYDRADRIVCPVCDALAHRTWAFAVRLSMPDHYNHAAGQYVSNEAALTEAFHVQSEKATARTGIPHKFAAVHPSDKETLGITDEGLDATHDRNVQSGKSAPVSKLR